MKFCLYSSTPGLERFSKSERFRVWSSTHKQLMRENAQYRSHVSGMTWRLIWAAVAFTIATLLCVLALSAIRGRWNVALTGCIVVLTIAYGIYNTVIAFRLQEFMNEKVGRA